MKTTIFLGITILCLSGATAHNDELADDLYEELRYGGLIEKYETAEEVRYHVPRLNGYLCARRFINYEGQWITECTKVIETLPLRDHAMHESEKLSAEEKEQLMIPMLMLDQQPDYIMDVLPDYYFDKIAWLYGVQQINKMR